jgi:type IV pilus assembly protein PilB
LFELLIMNDDMREMILRNVATDELKAKAVSYGMVPLRDYGLNFAYQGLTTLDEIVRETVHDA